MREDHHIWLHEQSTRSNQKVDDFYGDCLWLLMRRKKLTWEGKHEAIGIWQVMDVYDRHIWLWGCMHLLQNFFRKGFRDLQCDKRCISTFERLAIKHCCQHSLSRANCVRSSPSLAMLMSNLQVTHDRLLTQGNERKQQVAPI